MVGPHGSPAVAVPMVRASGPTGETAAAPPSDRGRGVGEAVGAEEKCCE